MIQCLICSQIGFHSTWCRRCSSSWPLVPPSIVENVFHLRSRRWGALGHADCRQQLGAEGAADVRSVRPTDVNCPGLDESSQPQTHDEELQGGETPQDRDRYRGVEHSRQSHTLHPQLLHPPPAVLAEGKLGWNNTWGLYFLLYVFTFQQVDCFIK